MLASIRPVPALALAALGFLLCGCGGGGGTGSGKDPNVYFVNASADAGDSDFLTNDVVREAALPYTSGSADFITLAFVSDGSGGYEVMARQTSSGDVLDVENRPFFKDTDTVLVGVGLKTVALGEELKRYRFVDIDVDRTAPNGNKARLYIVHGFTRETGQATPQIIFQNAGDNPQFATSGIDFGSFAQLLVDSGTMEWWAKREDSTSAVVYASATVTLDPASVYVVLVSGIENDPDPAKQPALTFIKIPTD